MTLLEVVLAVVLLTLVAASTMGALVFVSTAEGRSAQRLGAYETANRLVLQYFDNQDDMPSAGAVLSYDRYLYRWDMNVETVQMQFSEKETATRANQPMMTDRYQLLVFRVWPVSADEDHYIAPRGQEMATLARLYDSVQFTDNPDRMERLSDADLNRLTSRIMSSMGGGGGPATGGTQGNRPQPASGGGAPGRGKSGANPAKPKSSGGSRSTPRQPEAPKGRKGG